MGTAIQSKASHLSPHQWKPGQSGNPLGANARKYSVVNQVKSALNGSFGAKFEAQAVAKRLLGIIISKKTSPGVVVQACALIFQYTESKPVERIEIVNDDKRAKYLACLDYVKDSLAKAGKEIPPDVVLIDGIAQTYSDAPDVLSDMYNAGAVEG